MKAHEIDYHIYGEEMQYVEIELDPQEVVVAEAGSFMMMENGIKMETIFGDGSQDQQQGIFGKLLSAGKRVLTGESLFMTAYQNQDFGKRKVSFASPYPGKIVPIDLQQLGGKFICQKDSFLCAAKGVAVGIELSKKLGTGLFGGEGFIMQKKLSYAVREIINPEFSRVYTTSHRELRHTVGIDTSTVLVSKTGVRIDSDLVWVGPAANRSEERRVGKEC